MVYLMREGRLGMMRELKKCRKIFAFAFALTILSIGFMLIGRYNEVKAAPAVGDTVVDESYPYYTFKVVNADTYEVALVGAVSNNNGNYIIPGTIKDNAGNQYDVIKIEGFYFPLNAKTIEIGENITVIGEEVFGYLSYLQSVKFPNSLTEISKKAFERSGDYETGFILDLSNTKIETIDESAFDTAHITELKLPVDSNTLKTIGKKAFNYCTNISGRLVIPKSVVEIGDYAFYYNISLKIIDISYETNPKLENIGEHAFADCHMKGSISIPNTVTHIGDNAFESNEFDSLIIDNRNNILGKNVFFSSRPPKKISYMGPNIPIYEFSTIWGYVNDSNPSEQIGEFSIGEYSRNGYQGDYHENEDGFVYRKIDDYCMIAGVNKSMLPCTIPSEINGYPVKVISGFCNAPIYGQLTIPDTVEEIRGFAFAKCDGIKGELIIPNSVKEIGNGAFFGCSGLKSVTISDNVKKLFNYIFMGCNGLEKLVIPESLEKTDSSVFRDTGIIKEIVNKSNCILSVRLPEAPYYYFDSDNNISTDLINGSFTVRYDITDNPQITVNIKDIDNLIFKDTPIEPEVTIKKQDVVLVKDVDYQIKYKKRDYIIPFFINIAENYPYTIIGIGDYGGKISGEFRLKLDFESIYNKMIFIDTIKNPTYQEGVVSKPELFIRFYYDYDTFINQHLVENEDYTIECSNINAGPAKAIIKGLGDLVGSIEVDFNIEKADVINCELNMDDYSYLGVVPTPSITSNPGNATVTFRYYSDIDGIFGVKDWNGITNTSLEPGKYYMVANLSETENYNQYTTIKEFNVYPKVVTDPKIELSQSSYTYDGTEKTPLVTVKDGNTVIAETNYLVEYSNNINAGTATVSIKDTNGVQFVNASKTFTINKSDSQITVAPGASEIVYGAKLGGSTLTGGTANVAGTFTWKDSNIVPKVSDSNTTEYTVLFTPNDTNNYNTTEIKIKVNVKKAVFDTTAMEQLPEIPCNITTESYKALLEDIALRGTALGRYTMKNPSQVITDGENNVELIYTPKDANYNTVEITHSFTTVHDAGEWETVTEASATQAGKKVKKCLACHVVIDEEDIPATGTVTEIETGYMGDVNDDGIVNAKDVTALRRYLAGGWNVTINLTNADVNADGTVNAKDVTVLRRFLAGGWGVVL